MLGASPDVVAAVQADRLRRSERARLANTLVQSRCRRRPRRRSRPLLLIPSETVRLLIRRRRTVLRP